MECFKLWLCRYGKRFDSLSREKIFIEISELLNRVISDFFLIKYRINVRIIKLVTHDTARFVAVIYTKSELKEA